MSEWTELVEKGKSLLGTESGLQWEWGDLALEVEPLAGDQERGGGGEWAGAKLERLEKWADEIGFTAQGGKKFGSLTTYRRVAARWPVSRRLLTVSFTIHQELAYREDRFEVVKTPGLTCDEARALARGDHMPSNSGPGRKPLTRVAVKLSEARAALVTALEGIRLGEFRDDPQALELLTAELELVETALGWIKTFLESGTVDQEFEAVLEKVRGK